MYINCNNSKNSKFLNYFTVNSRCIGNLKKQLLQEIIVINKCQFKNVHIPEDFFCSTDWFLMEQLSL